MGSCLTISHTCLPYPPSGRVSTCVPSVIKGSRDALGAVNVRCVWVVSVWNLYLQNGVTRKLLNVDQIVRSLTCGDVDCYG